METITTKKPKTKGVLHPNALVLHLQQVMVERIKKNPRYSLRAFAQALDVDASLLSKIFHGERNISPRLFKKIVQFLALSKQQAEQYAEALGFHMRTGQVATQGPSYRALSVSDFTAIADWSHYAIFELMRLPCFRSNTQWIAGTVGISAAEVSLCLQRLEKINIIKRVNKKWVRISDHISNGGIGFTADALRNFQKQVLTKAMEALDCVPISDRDQSSMTMPIDSRLLPLAKEKIARFRRELSDLLENSKNLDSVYNLCISLYPLTYPQRRHHKC